MNKSSARQYKCHLSLKYANIISKQAPKASKVSSVLCINLPTRHISVHCEWAPIQSNLFFSHCIA